MHVGRWRGRCFVWGRWRRGCSFRKGALLIERAREGGDGEVSYPGYHVSPTV